MSDLWRQWQEIETSMGAIWWEMYLVGMEMDLVGDMPPHFFRIQTHSLTSATTRIWVIVNRPPPTLQKEIASLETSNPTLVSYIIYHL